MEKFNKIVLNIPHSSTNGVFMANSGWHYNANLINMIQKETDYHTDFIFDSDNPNVVSCVFGYSRYLVDVERLENDPLENEGRGILYNKFGLIKRDELDEETRTNLLKLRNDYLESISKEITPDTLLIDCHSFNKEIDEEIDICIGFNEDWSKPDEDTINGIINIFKNAGYKVGINKPYSNSITPKSEYKYKSIMIEVNKNLYLRHGYYINTDTFYGPRLSDTIKKVYSFVLS